MMSCNKSLQNLKSARSSLLDELLLFRFFGLKTEPAASKLAAFCGISKRRVYSIIFRETTAPLADSERRTIEQGALAAKRWLADYLHAWAHDLHKQADLQEIRERETKCAYDRSPLPLAASAILSSACPSGTSCSPPLP